MFLYFIIANRTALFVTTNKNRINALIEYIYICVIYEKNVLYRKLWRCGGLLGPVRVVLRFSLLSLPKALDRSGTPRCKFFLFFFARPREREWVECPVWLFGLSLCLPVRRLCARCPRLVARLHTRTQKARLHGVGQPIGLSKWGDRLRPASATDYYDYSITTTCNTKKATFVSVTRGAAGSVVWHFAMHTKNKAPKQKKIESWRDFSPPMETHKFRLKEDKHFIRSFRFRAGDESDFANLKE